MSDTFVKHVHERSCNRIATIRYMRSDRTEATWIIGAWCWDDEASARLHLQRWAPAGSTFLSVTFSATP